MSKYELWIMVVGGNDDDERIVYKGDSKQDLEQSVLDHQEEVITDMDKYFELISERNDFNNDIFYSYADFCNFVSRKLY